MNANRVKYGLYILTGVYIMLLVCMMLKLSQGVGWDPALNIKMTDNAQRNIQFNYYAHPDPANLSCDKLEFVAWWTPGQYALPLLVKNLLHVKISVAIKVITAISLLLSAWGIFKLFNLLAKPAREETSDQSPPLAISFILFTLLQPFFWRSLFEYDGGVLLLNAYCPWFFYGVAKIKRLSITTIALLLLSAFIGFFLKAAFTGIFAGALFYLFLLQIVEEGVTIKKLNLKKTGLTALYLGVVLAVYLLVIKAAFLNHNTNISDSSLGIRPQARVIIFPLDAPVLGLFSVPFLNKTIQWIMALVVVIPGYYLIFSNKQLNQTHRLILIGFVPATILFYMLLYFINVDVSYELRHFIPITILLTPAFFAGIAQIPFGKVFTYCIMSIYSGINIYMLVDKIKSTPPEGPSNMYSGINLSYPTDLIEKMHSLDNQNKKGTDIFYMQSSAPALALEIKNNRVLLEDNYINFHFYNAPRFKSTLYFGRTNGELYVVYPETNFKHDSIKFLTRFEQYKSFEKIFQTKGFVILKAIPLGK